MNKLLTVILAITLTTSSVYAQGKIVPIEEGQPAEFTGYLIDKEFEKERRQDKEEIRLERHKNVLLSDLKVISDKRVELYHKEAERANSELQREKNLNAWKQIGWFALGVLTTGLGAYAAGKALR